MNPQLNQIAAQQHIADLLRVAERDRLAPPATRGASVHDRLRLRLRGLPAARGTSPRGEGSASRGVGPSLTARRLTERLTRSC